MNQNAVSAPVSYFLEIIPVKKKKIHILQLHQSGAFQRAKSQLLSDWQPAVFAIMIKCYVYNL